MSARDLMKDAKITTLIELVNKLGGQLTESMVEQALNSNFYQPITPLPKPSRRTRAYRSLRKWLWHCPWAAVHRYAPGQCDCDCGDDW